MFLVGLLFFFVLVFSVMGLLMYLDAKTLVARPPKLSIAEGSAEAVTDQASATHDEDAKTGRMRVEAVLNGSGRGHAACSLGHEFALRGKKPVKFYVIVEYEYRAAVQVADGPGKSRAVLALHIGEKSTPISETLQAGVGHQNIPLSGSVSGESESGSKKVLTTLKPGPTRVWLGLTASAEQSAESNASCRVEANAKITAITVKPTVGSLFT